MTLSFFCWKIKSMVQFKLRQTAQNNKSTLACSSLSASSNSVSSSALAYCILGAQYYYFIRNSFAGRFGRGHGSRGQGIRDSKWFRIRDIVEAFGSGILLSERTRMDPVLDRLHPCFRQELRWALWPILLKLFSFTKSLSCKNYRIAVWK